MRGIKNKKRKKLRINLILSKYKEKLQIKQEINKKPKIIIEIKKINNKLKILMIIENYKNYLDKLIPNNKKLPKNAISKKGKLSLISREIIEEINYTYDKNKQLTFKLQNPHNKKTKKYKLKKKKQKQDNKQN